MPPAPNFKGPQVREIALSSLNRYNFPMNYTCAYIANGVLDWFFAGLAMAAIVKQPSAI